MLKASPAKARAATWMTMGNSSPAILYRLGVNNSNPCDDEKDVANEPDTNAPCNAPADSMQTDG